MDAEVIQPYVYPINTFAVKPSNGQILMIGREVLLQSFNAGYTVRTNGNSAL